MARSGGFAAGPGGTQDARHAGEVNRDFKAPGDALERGVVEDKDEMAEWSKELRPVGGIDRVHAFDPTNPGRILHLECAVWTEAQGGERMPLERFIAGRPEYVSVGMLEPD